MKRLVLLLAMAAAPAWGWRCDGHQMTALIAERHLNPRALAAVMDLLKNQPFDHSTRKYCLEGPDDLMADASTWADDVKSSEKTGPWHYIDIPRGVERGDLNEYCTPVGPAAGEHDRPGCLISAMKYEYGILRDANAAPAARAEALRYLIHFLGELHQPLHTTDNNDHGGNCVPLRFFNQEKPVNLHDVWDYLVLDREMYRRHSTVPRFAEILDRKFQDRWKAWGQAPVDFDAWAWEQHRIADEITYGKLRPAVPIETPKPHVDCRAESHKLEPLHLRVADSYQAAAGPMVEREMAQGGYRLAGLLNGIWPE